MGAGGLLRIPAAGDSDVAVRMAPLADRDVFAPASWPMHPLGETQPGWFEIDPDTLGLTDGDWEYEFVLAGAAGDPVADPYAVSITRFGGYRFKFLPHERDEYQRTLMVCTRCNHKEPKPGQATVNWRADL